MSNNQQSVLNTIPKSYPVSEYQMSICPQLAKFSKFLREQNFPSRLKFERRLVCSKDNCRIIFVRFKLRNNTKIPISPIFLFYNALFRSQSK